MPNLNDDIPWNESDTLDLMLSIAHGDNIEDISDFLCRGETAVRQMVGELGLDPTDRAAAHQRAISFARERSLEHLLTKEFRRRAP